MKNIIVSVCALVCVAMVWGGPVADAGDLKVGYVDLRRAFFEYEKAQQLDAEITEFAEANQDKRDTMIREITRMRDELEIMSEEARRARQLELDEMVRELQQFDMQSREVILERKDNFFREVMDDIQAVVVSKGDAGGYDYILDSRNIMYANEEYDLTQEVIQELNR